MYLQNKYTRWYYQIISRAQLRKVSNSIYYEYHHIIPKSLNGSNSVENLVHLTAREHFICHWLLTKMVSGIPLQKMTYAFRAMLNLNPNNLRYTNSLAYEKNRIDCAKLSSESRKGILVGEKNYNFGKRWSDEQKTKMSNFRKGKCFRSNFKYSDESKEKMKHSANSRWTIEEREKQSNRRLSNMFAFTCPHCGKIGKGKSNYLRWHGDNCKKKDL